MHSNKALTSMLFQHGKMTKSIMTAVSEKPDDVSEWRNILQLMYHLRQTLACCVCGRLVLKLYTPVQEPCHWVCSNCHHNSTQIKHNCITCREALRGDGGGFIISSELKNFGSSFVTTCRYLVSTEIVHKWFNLEVITQNGPVTFGQLIDEGRNPDGIVSSQSLGDKFRKRVKQKEHHCRCGSGAKKNEGRGPGNLTCLGQRCACYKEGKACVNCKCVGCKNPNGASSNE